MGYVRIQTNDESSSTPPQYSYVDIVSSLYSRIAFIQFNRRKYTPLYFIGYHNNA